MLTNPFLGSDFGQAKRVKNSERRFSPVRQPGYQSDTAPYLQNLTYTFFISFGIEVVRIALLQSSDVKPASIPALVAVSEKSAGDVVAFAVDARSIARRDMKTSFRRGQQMLLFRRRKRGEYRA